MTDVKIPRNRADRADRWPNRERFAAAVIGAIVVAVGLLLLARPGEVEQAELAAPPDTPVDLAYRIVDARNAFDAEAVTALLGSAEYGFGGPVDLTGFAQWVEVYDWRLIDPTCEQTTNSQVVCSYTVSNVLTRHAGLEGEVDGTLRLFFSSGQLSSASETVDTGVYSRAFDPFFDWVSRNHGEDVDVLWDTSLGIRPRLNDESIRLFDQMLTEYMVQG